MKRRANILGEPDDVFRARNKTGRMGSDPYARVALKIFQCQRSVQDLGQIRDNVSQLCDLAIFHGDQELLARDRIGYNDRIERRPQDQSVNAWFDVPYGEIATYIAQGLWRGFFPHRHDLTPIGTHRLNRAQVYRDTDHFLPRCGIDDPPGDRSL
jgi:hypothetical protein